MEEMKTGAILSLAAKYIAELHAAYRNVNYVEDFTTTTLADLGVKAVVLDHDGVLGPNRSEGPDETGLAILAKCVETFGSGRVFILSNTRAKQDARSRTYERIAPDVTYIRANHKPDPEGLLTASRQCGVAMGDIAVVDDGLMTGVLMAVSCGSRPVYARRRRLRETLRAKMIRLFTTWPQIMITNVLYAFAKRRRVKNSG